ncbi:hypothetical protein HDU67_003750, partial [Dinochytrium kinnereticum]
MTFYEKNKFSNWKSIFDLSGDDKTTRGVLPSPILDDAAAILRTFGAEESVRPMLAKLAQTNSNPDDLTEVGSVSFHLHDVMKASPIAGTYDLWNENIQVGDIDLELTFNYGRFGYGYSYQLDEEDITAEEQVQYSLLPRILPPRDQREPEDAVMVVCATPHPKFIPFKEEVHLSYGKEIKEALEEAAELSYKPSAFVKEMSNFEQARDQ